MPEKNIKKKNKQNNTNIRKIMIGILSGVFSGSAVYFLITALIAVIVFKNNLNNSVFGIFMLIPASASGFICGYLAVVPVKKNGFIIGLISALPLFFIVAAVSVFFSKSAISITGWTSLGAMLVCAGTAGILSANKNNSKRKRKRY